MTKGNNKTLQGTQVFFFNLNHIDLFFKNVQIIYVLQHYLLRIKGCSKKRGDSGLIHIKSNMVIGKY